ncbi:hypothetical protein FNV43_RR12815 [Rhamnella rubrinervis]|uniref:Uncharacterized protein n=1 Tax=Rhamnella rubrinervis TaxID=2594499 RepID=A0A8K0H945_9ROSA|nr:hypothetical protein FNV43_RR12815 [Rhamnella rubrinervis]
MKVFPPLFEKQDSRRHASRRPRDRFASRHEAPHWSHDRSSPRLFEHDPKFPSRRPAYFHLHTASPSAKKKNSRFRTPRLASGSVVQLLPSSSPTKNPDDDMLSPHEPSSIPTGTDC